MKQALLASLVAASVSFAMVNAAEAATVGQPAPAFTLKDTNGKTVNLADYKGKTVVLEWHNPACPFVVKHYDTANMQGLQSKYGKDGLTIVAVNVDQKREEAEKFLAQLPAQFTVAFDAAGTTPKAYSAKAMPSSMLIGPDGTVRFVHHGFREDQKQAVESKIRDALRSAPRTVMLDWPLEFRHPVIN